MAAPGLSNSTVLALALGGHQLDGKGSSGGDGSAAVAVALLLAPGGLRLSPPPPPPAVPEHLCSVVPT